MNESSSSINSHGDSIGDNEQRSRNLDGLIEQVKDGTTKDYIQNRILPNMRYYSDMSRQYKAQYLRLMYASVILGALVPVCTVVSGGSVSQKIVLISLSVGAMAINLFLALNNYKDLWLTYRKARETLESTLYLYFTGTEAFRGNDQDEKNRILIEHCEEELNSTYNTWRSIVDK